MARALLDTTRGTDMLDNRLAIFDLDGVLIESRDLHYDSLNNALALFGKEFIISREEHLSTYDGLSTTKKLSMLSESKGLPSELHASIWKAKQEQTIVLLKNFEKNHQAIQIFDDLKSRGWKIAVASNSIRETVKVALHSAGVLHLIDYMVSNEDVKHHKPHPEMYWACMVACDADPRRTVIVEDSHVGREGASNSGATLYPVKNSLDLTYSKFIEMIDKFEGTQKKVLWNNKGMNVLIPMAGAGSRFAQAGYTFPKPLIEVHGKPMIQVVVENLNVDAHFIFLVQKEHYDKYNLKQVLSLISPGCDVIQVDGITEGAACTTLLAESLIDNEDPLLIANSDQIMEWDSSECLYAFEAGSIDAGIMTFKSTHPKWSYAKLDNDGFVSEVAEKNPISDNATVGVYYWSHGSDYVKYAHQMINKNIRTNNEFYVCPVFNEAIADGKKVRPSLIDKMWGIGTPEDLNYYLESHAK